MSNPRQCAAQEVFGRACRRRGGQSTLEYAVVIAVVVAAAVAMQIYMKRGVQGKLRAATDDIGGQFSPTAYKGKFETIRRSATEEGLFVSGADVTLNKGESLSRTTTITGGNINLPPNVRSDSIATERKSQTGETETLTGAQSTESRPLPLP